MTERAEDSTGGYKTPRTFAELAKLNVNQYVEKKGEGDRAVSYISWARAVEMLFSHDPDASWEYLHVNDLPYMRLPVNGTADADWTAMVVCTVKAFGRTRSCQLPVLDHKNRAIVNPTSMEINTAMQRCLAKAIALHGIGLYIYAGEDLPTEIADEARELYQLIDTAKTAEVLEALVPKISELVESQPELRGYFNEAYKDRKSALTKKGLTGLKDRIKTPGKEQRANG